MLKKFMLVSLALAAVTGCKKEASGGGASNGEALGAPQQVLAEDRMICKDTYNPTTDGPAPTEENIICWRTSEGEIFPTLINGQEVDIAKWKYIVRIRVGNSGCSATVVGPRVVITAAHCGTTGAVASFAIGTKNFTGKIERSSLYPGRDHDVSVIITDQEIAKADVDAFAVVGGSATVGTEYYLLGYGCTNSNGSGGNDGKLRAGKSKMSGTSGYDMVSGGGGSALCFGDSGGPLNLTDDNTKPVLLGVASKGNIRDTNYHVRLDTQESKDFLRAMETKHNVKICGFGGDAATCGVGPDPGDDDDDDDDNGPCDELAKKQTLLRVAECFEVPIVIPTQ